MIPQRLNALRTWMRKHDMDAFIFPSTDPHNGEYVPDHWKGREWVSGFNGSAGTAVVTLQDAALWTDSRYFIAAAQQLEGTGFVLMRERMPETPSVAEWIAESAGSGRIGMDGMVNSVSIVNSLKDQLRHLGDFEVVTDYDPLEDLWTDRPGVPDDPVVLHPIEFSGEAATSKIQRVRHAIVEMHASAILVTALDDVAWTLNLRGNDVHCNPVFVSYLLITLERVVLFVDKVKITSEVADYLQEMGVETAGYGKVADFLSKLGDQCLLMDSNKVNDTLFHAVRNPICATSPIPAMKAVKNTVEMDGFRRAMIRDGVAMVKFLCQLQQRVEQGVETELSVDERLTALRAEDAWFRGNSFDTIAAYGAHGAVVHYEATPETNVMLQPRGFLLLDSGGQYLDGTTDITRTIALGELTEREREVYTLVLKGHIQLQLLKFPSGACGSQLDAVARRDLWKAGLNFMHGTGHGVGAFLNVHEGPHQIRQEWWPAPLRPGMNVTDEPGIYIENEFGVRIENTLLIVPYMKTEMGEFLQFETLTLCPIDLTPIIKSMMTDEEVLWLNDYHHTVYERLSPYLNDVETAWLRNACRPL
mgnify:CR=1 FL=1